MTKLYELKDKFYYEDEQGALFKNSDNIYLKLGDGYKQIEKNGDIRINVDSEDIEKLYNKLGCSDEFYEGSLQDNYLYGLWDKVYINGHNEFDYLIITEEALNEWSSSQVALLTNDTEKVIQFENAVREYEKREWAYI